MKTPTGRVVGVLQLINAMRGGQRVVPYSEQSAGARAVAGVAGRGCPRQQPAVRGDPASSSKGSSGRRSWRSRRAIRRRRVIRSASPISPSRSPKPPIAPTRRGAVASVRFSRDDLRTIRYAALLHDFGKVGVREEILVKAKKLHPAQLDRVRERFRLARRTLELVGRAAASGLRAGQRRGRVPRACARPSTSAAAGGHRASSIGDWPTSSRPTSRTSCRTEASSACVTSRPDDVRDIDGQRRGRCFATRKCGGCRCARARCRSASGSRSRRTCCTPTGSCIRFPGRARSGGFRPSRSATTRS